MLEVIDGAILANTPPINVPGGQTASGGGIHYLASGKLIVPRGTIAGHEAAHGGGIDKGGGTVESRGSTISGTQATGSGGGIANAGMARISFATTAFNEANRPVPGGWPGRDPAGPRHRQRRHARPRPRGRHPGHAQRHRREQP